MSHVDQGKRNVPRKNSTPKTSKGLAAGTKCRDKVSPEDTAVVALAPCYNAAAVVRAFTRDTFGEVGLLAAGEELIKRCDHVRANKTGRMEDMLTAQAHSLDVVFASLARRAARNIGHESGQFLNAGETYMKLALRAQNQCRMTLETLATIKNPPVVFAKQANIANNQQVNNGEAVPVAYAAESQNQPNEQSRIGHDKGQSLDGETLQGAIGSCATLEAVAAVDGPQDRQG